MKRSAWLIVIVAFACILNGCKKEQSKDEDKPETGTVTPFV